MSGSLDTRTQQSSSTLPKHIAIICDGNRRWAKEHGWEVFLGHRYAAEHTFEPLIDRAAEVGIEYLTFWVFSTENWKRKEKEVSYLLEMLREFFDKQVERLHEKEMRFQLIGDISKFPDDIQERLVRGEELTADNTGLTVVFALNYGGRDELVRACNKAISDMPGHEFSVAELSSYLDTKDMPDPDFIIRTGGEQRLSGFLLWQSEYAELAFPEFYFPEFTPEKLDELLAEFAERQRRFGG